jgi:hypothetical protein
MGVVMTDLKQIIRKDVKNIFSNESDRDFTESITWYPAGDISKKQIIHGQVFGGHLEGDRSQPGDGRVLRLDHVTAERRSLTIQVPVSDVWATANDRHDVFEFNDYPGTWTFKRVLSQDHGCVKILVVKRTQFETRQGANNE